MSTSQADVIRAIMASTGASSAEATQALLDGRAKVKVDGREYTIQPDGTVPTREPMSDVVLKYFYAEAPR